MSEEEPPVVFEPVADEIFASRETVYKQLFVGCSANDAKTIAKEERSTLTSPVNGSLALESLTYAEIDIKIMRHIIDKCASIGPLTVGQGSFVDLGSGAGKAAMAAALLGPWAKVTGIEFLAKLHEKANKSVENLQANPLHAEVAFPEVSFVKGDFASTTAASPLKPLGPDCTCALAVATMYQEPQLNAMTELAKAMPLNSFFITISQKLAKAGDEWEQVHSEQMEFGWGLATWFLFKKMPPPEEEKVVVEGEEEADPEAGGDAEPEA